MAVESTNGTHRLPMSRGSVRISGQVQPGQTSVTWVTLDVADGGTGAVRLEGTPQDIVDLLTRVAKQAEVWTLVGNDENGEVVDAVSVFKKRGRK